MALPPSPTIPPITNAGQNYTGGILIFPDDTNGGIIGHITRMMVASFNQEFPEIKVYDEQKDNFLPMLVIHLTDMQRVMMKQHSMTRREYTFEITLAVEVKGAGTTGETGLETSFYNYINMIDNWINEQGRQGRWKTVSVINGDKLPSSVNVEYIQTDKKIGVAIFNVVVEADKKIATETINVDDYISDPSETLSFHIYGIPISDSEGNTKWKSGTSVTIPALYNKEVVIT